MSAVALKEVVRARQRIKRAKVCLVALFVLEVVLFYGWLNYSLNVVSYFLGLGAVAFATMSTIINIHQIKKDADLIRNIEDRYHG